MEQNEQPVRGNKSNSKSKSKGRWKLFAVLAVCATPMIASYLTYYVIKPQSRTNYGTLLDPRAHPIPSALHATTLDGQPASLEAYKGKWMMVQAGSGDCADACKNKLFEMRQLRLTQGKDRDRIERIWLITDYQPIETILIREYDGMRMLRVKPEILNKWLPADLGTSVSDHIYMIDPLGNLMMRFPKDADPNKMKKDITKLLKASRIG